MHIIDTPLVLNEANLYQFLIFSDTAKFKSEMLCPVFRHRTFANFRRKLEKYRFEGQNGII